jgi:hypothetical protein
MNFDSHTVAIIFGVILQLSAIIAGLWGLARRLSRLEMMVDLMWDAFAARFGIREHPRRKRGEP